MKNRYLLLVSIVVIMQACIKDNGNYDYIKLSEPKVKKPAGTISAVIGQPLEIIPEYSFPKGDSLTDLSFEWNYGKTILSSEKSLKIENLDLPIGDNQLLFSMIDKKTNIKYSKLFVLSVSSPYHLCWLILSESDNKRSSLSYMKKGDYIDVDPDDKNYERYEWFKDYDLYEKSMNGESLGISPVKLIDHNNVPYSKKNGGVLVIHKESDDLEINGETMKRVSSIEEQFIDKKLPKDFELVDAAYAAWGTYLLSADGKVYTNRFSDLIYYHGYFSQTPLMMNADELNVKQLIPTAFRNCYTWCLFDATKKAFISVFNNESTDAGLSGTLVENKAVYWPSGFSPLTNIGDHELVFAGYVNSGRDNIGTEGSPKKSAHYISILKNNTNSDIYLQKFQTEVRTLATAKYSIVAMFQSKVTGMNTLLRENSQIVINANANIKTVGEGKIFFSSENGLYWVSPNDCVIHKLDEAPVGRNITALELDNSGTELAVGYSDGYFAVYRCREADLTAAKPIFVLKPEKIQSSNKVVDIVWKNSHQTQGYLFDK